MKTYAILDSDIPVEVLDFKAANIHGEVVTSYFVRVFDNEDEEIEMWADSSKISELCLCGE